MVRDWPLFVGLLTVGLCSIVAQAAPSQPFEFSTTSSSSYGTSGLDTPLTSYPSSATDGVHGQQTHTTDEPPLLHHEDGGDAPLDEPGLGPPEDSDSSLTTARKSKSPRRRKRQASTPSSDFRLILQFVDPRLLDNNDRPSSYAYESKHVPTYTAGDKSGIAGDTIVSPPSESPTRHREPRIEGYYRCDFTVDGQVCGKGHDTQAALNHHKKYHRPKTFKCNVEGCSSEFSVQDQLARHERQHNPVKKYFCDFCGTGTNRHDAWKKHEKTNKHKAKLLTVIHQDPMDGVAPTSVDAPAPL